MNAPPYCLRSVSRPEHREREVGGVRHSPCTDKMRSGVWGHKGETKKEQAAPRENSGALQRVRLQSFSLVPACEETTRKHG